MFYKPHDWINSLPSLPPNLFPNRWQKCFLEPGEHFLKTHQQDNPRLPSESPSCHPPAPSIEGKCLPAPAGWSKAEQGRGSGHYTGSQGWAHNHCLPGLSCIFVISIWGHFSNIQDLWSEFGFSWGKAWERESSLESWSPLLGNTVFLYLVNFALEFFEMFCFLPHACYLLAELPPWFCSKIFCLLHFVYDVYQCCQFQLGCLVYHTLLWNTVCEMATPHRAITFPHCLSSNE